MKLRWEKGGIIRDWEIQPRASALLLLDMQVGNVDPRRGAGPELTTRFPQQAAYYYDALRTHALPAAAKLLAFFREHGLTVVHAHSGGSAAHLASWSWRIQASGIPCLEASVEAWPSLAPSEGELVLIKQTLSPFNGTAIDQYLRNMGVENVVLAGVLTNAAVETTARNAGDRGFNAILAADACAALSPEDQRAGTAFASWHIVRTAAEIIDELGGLLAG